MKRNQFRLKALAGAILLSGFAGSVVNAAPSAQYSTGPISTGSAETIVSSGSDALGDTLLYPFYHVGELVPGTLDQLKSPADDHRTLISLVNSNADDTTIVKVRLRDYKDSDDVLDITVTLSPNDVFTGTIHNKLVDGKIRTVFTRSSHDTTCVSPYQATSRTFVPKIGNDFELTGHVEVITMATFNQHDVDSYTIDNTDATTIAATTAEKAALQDLIVNSTHAATGNNPDSGQTPSCAKVDSYFDNVKGADGRYIGLLQDALDGMPIRSNLFGSYSILNTNSGVAVGGRPTTIAGAFSNSKAGDDQAIAANKALTLESPCFIGAGSGTASNICGQFDAHYSFPSLIHVNGVHAVTPTNAQILTNVTNYNSFEDTIRAVGMANQWSKNSENGVDSELIFTLPTKYIHADNYEAVAGTPASGQTVAASTADTEDVFVPAGVPNLITSVYDGVDTSLSTGGLADAGSSGYFIDSGDAAGCVSFSVPKWDREEQSGPSTGTSTSGGQEDRKIDYLCNEATAFTVNGKGATQTATSPVILSVDTSQLNQPFGWMKVLLSQHASTAADGNVDIDIDDTVQGLPMIGYSMRSSTFGIDANGHYGTKTDNIKYN